MATPVLNLRYNITNVVASSFPGASYTLLGNVFDESGNFNGTNVALNDEVFDFNGGRYRILNFISQSSSTLHIDVDNFHSDGLPTTGNGVIFRPSQHFDLPIPTRQANFISEYLQNFIQNQAIQDLDKQIFTQNTFIDEFTLTGTDITNGYVALSNVPNLTKPIVVQPRGGTVQIYSTDFSISGSHLVWSGTFASTVQSGDVLVITYYPQ